jgi:hypothetical protein
MLFRIGGCTVEIAGEPVEIHERYRRFESVDGVRHGDGRQWGRVVALARCFTSTRVRYMAETERRWQPAKLPGDIPAPVGAYSPAVRAGDFVFVSGQVPKDPRTGKLAGEDIESQTKQVLENVRNAFAR